MIYKTQYGTVDFWTPHNLEQFSKIGINLSGGCDSSLLLFFTLRELKPHQTIIPITGVHNARPSNIAYAGTVYGEKCFLNIETNAKIKPTTNPAIIYIEDIPTICPSTK